MVKFNKIKSLVLNWNLDKVLILSGITLSVFIIAFFVWWRSGVILIENPNDGEAMSKLNKSSISGISCENYNRRPVSVMMAADPETRPLSGIGEADIVFEMPVTPNGITRFMAVFQCTEPKEIGSIRSARSDFIPLASGLGSIYAHWGGEREALEKLNNHIAENIDAMKYEGTVFYRKKNVPMPHNGFTDIGKILEQAKKLGYSLNNSFECYPHDEKEIKKNISNLAEEILIDYLSPYNVKWIYDKQKNEYKRFRSNQPEIDKNTDEQVWAKVVAVLRTTSKYLSKDYISVNTQGGGDGVVYQGGIAIPVKWQKDAGKLDSKLYFYDSSNKEIKFLPGQIWVEILTD